MEFIGWLPLVLIGMCLVSMTMYHFEKKELQRTIDKLTDKLMSKDYSEYKRNENVTQPTETKMRKKQSFYDDPSIELDEESIN